MGWEDWLAHVQAVPSGAAGGIYDITSGYPNAEFGSPDLLLTPDTVLNLVNMVKTSSSESVFLGHNKAKKLFYLKGDDNSLSFKKGNVTLVVAVSKKCLVCCVVDDANVGPRQVLVNVSKVAELLMESSF